MKRKVAGFVLALFAIGLVGLGECATPECLLADWFQEPPFATSIRNWNPYTFGLPVGASAPPIGGVDFSAGNTVLVVIDTHFNPTLPLFIREWGQITNLQVVVAATKIMGRERDLRATLGERVQLIVDPAARRIAALYQVGERVLSVTFLVNEQGMIIYRRRSTGNRLSRDRILRHFAVYGTLPENTLIQHILWYGDQVPWPTFPLTTLAGEEVWLAPGRPRLIYTGWVTGNQGAAFQELEKLRLLYPQVEFIWLNRYSTEESQAGTWEISRRIGLDEVHPEWYAIPLEEYLVRARRHSKDAVKEEIARIVLEHDIAWSVLFDTNMRLRSFWNIFVSPGVMLIDAQGKIIFPCMLYMINLITGEPVPHPGAKEELARLIEEMLGE